MQLTQTEASKLRAQLPQKPSLPRDAPEKDASSPLAAGRAVMSLPCVSCEAAGDGVRGLVGADAPLPCKTPHCISHQRTLAAAKAFICARSTAL